MTAVNGAVPARAIAASWGLLSAVVLLMLGNGLLGSLVGIRSELERFPLRAIGVIMAAYFAGFLFGSQLAPRAVARVGHVRVFAALASLASTAALVHAVFVQPAVWGAMRLLTGFCLAGLYVVSESWLNELATNETRGRLMSAYMVAVMGGMAAGQIFLEFGNPLTFQLFVVASVLTSLAVVPVSLSIGTAPAFTLPKPVSARHLWKAAPLGIVGGLGTGMANAAFLGMGAVYATRVGMDPGRVALFIGAGLLGAVALQWPIGAMSDRVPRRNALLAVTLAAAAIAVVSANLAVDGWQLIVATFLFGGLTFPLYALCLSHINDVLPRGQAIAASSVFVFVTGVGAIFGPIVAALWMGVAGPNGFYWTLATVHAVIGAYAIYRIARRDPVATEDQDVFVQIPARAAAITTAWRTPRSSDPTTATDTNPGG